MDLLILCAQCLLWGAAVILFSIFLPSSLYFYYFLLANILLYIILTISTYSASKRLFCRRRIRPDNKAVLITGCGSGFGKELAKRLDSKGFQVFASCHNPEGPGVDELRKSCTNRLNVFSLDVINDASVEEAVKFVKMNLGSNELWAVVNNAGTSKAFASFDISSLDNFKETMDVNVFGTIRVTKAFLPLLKKSKGRIVNVNSIAGRLPFVEMCAYAVSKAAGVTLSQCLSLEMKNWGIHVISIEPEGFRTGITNIERNITRRRNEFRKVSRDIASTYGVKYERKVEEFEKRILRGASGNIDNVTDAMESAITLKNPCHVYTPCRNILAEILVDITKNIPYEIYEIGAVIVMRILGYPSSKDMLHHDSV